MPKGELELKQAERKAKAQALTVLTHYPEWELYRTELEQMELRLQERLLTCPREDTDHVRGLILGLRTAFHYPETLNAAL